MSDIDLKSLARLGAQARLAELTAEKDAILKAFPDLGGGAVVWGDSSGGGIRPSEWGEGTGTGVRPRRKRSRRRRFQMTPAQRKAVSARMKKYWAGRRRAKGKARQTEREAPKSAVKHSPWTPAKRRAAADRARQMWAERRKAKKGG